MHIACTDQLQLLSAANPRNETQQGSEPAFQHGKAHPPRLMHTHLMSSAQSSRGMRPS